MESLEKKIKRQFEEMKLALALLKKEAELENLVHITTKLKLANAVDLLGQAYHQMLTYAPDSVPDPDYDDVVDRIDTFLTEIKKSDEKEPTFG